MRHGRPGIPRADKDGLARVRNITVIGDTLELARRAGKNPPAPGELRLDDRPTFELISSGETLGCFQLESTAMRGLLRRLRPSDIRELMAAIALHRPGPWDTGAVERFIKGKRGEQPPSRQHPAIDPILDETHGVVLYQEQIMEIARTVAGFDLGKADLLRECLCSPGSQNEKRKWLQEFEEGAVRNGFSPADARAISALLGRSGGYSFNKAHAAAYARISYTTAYLKAHHTSEFFTALLRAGTGYYSPGVYLAKASRNGIELGFAHEQLHLFNGIMPGFTRKPGVASSAQLQEMEPGSQVALAGKVISAFRYPGKNGRYSLILVLSDEEGMAEAVLSPSIYRRYCSQIDPQGVVLWGRLAQSSGFPRILVAGCRTQ